MQKLAQRKMAAGGIAAAIVLGVGALAGAAAGAGPFSSSDSGVDSPRDVQERGTAVTTPDPAGVPAADPTLVPPTLGDERPGHDANDINDDDANDDVNDDNQGPSANRGPGNVDDSNRGPGGDDGPGHDATDDHGDNSGHGGGDD